MIARQNSIISKLKTLLWPARPAPAQSKKSALNRLGFAASVIALCFFALSAKAIYLTVIIEKDSQLSGKSALPAQRG
ncbi:MAG: hypothetical protein ACPIB7_05360, partial [Candidatus Puniceispirillaceae bacterium]